MRKKKNTFKSICEKNGSSQNTGIHLKYYLECQARRTNLFISPTFQNKIVKSSKTESPVPTAWLQNTPCSGRGPLPKGTPLEGLKPHGYRLRFMKVPHASDTHSRIVVVVVVVHPSVSALMVGCTISAYACLRMFEYCYPEATWEWEQLIVTRCVGKIQVGNENS